MTRTRSLLAALLLTLLAAVVLTGCSWLGKGKEVADAYTATQNAKSASFTGSYALSKLRRSGVVVKTWSAQFSGAYDELDDARPKSRFETVIDGEQVYAVAPGNGRAYLQVGRDVTSTKLGKNKKPAGTPTSNKITSAFANSVVNFRDGAPLVRPDGQQVPTVVADVSRVKFCGPSLRQIVRAVNTTSSAGGKIHISKKFTRSLTRMCAKLLWAPPVLTFGIQNGFLTDLVVDIAFRDDARYRLRFEMHFSGIGAPQSDFAIPKQSKSKGGWAPLKRELHSAFNHADSTAQALY